MPPAPSSCVLLSTYNGARHLDEQLDSVLVQDVPGVLRVLVRDDGSRDGTIALLEDRARRDPRVVLDAGQNIGVVRSFHQLLADDRAEADYVAFCDQDDVWLPGKLARGIRTLERFGATPALYCARVALVDAALRPLGDSPPIQREPAFENALVENIATGCTIVMNAAARALLLSAWPDRRVNMHDWWAYLVVSAFGHVVYDSEPCLLYRQHGGNVVGARVGWRLWVQRGARFLDGSHRTLASEQAEEFAARYGARLTARHRRTLERFLAGRRSAARRLRYAATADVWRQRTIDSAILRCLYALGRV